MPDSHNLIEELRVDAKKTRDFLSNRHKSDRECAIVRAFLRCIGVSFDKIEIQPAKHEPVDVTFRCGRFQIREIVGDKKRGKDWEERERRYEEAQQLSKLWEPWTPSRKINCADLLDSVSDALQKKSKHYGEQQCRKLDALVYFDPGRSHLYPPEFDLCEAVAKKLSAQAWRSVQILTIPYGLVAIATAEAPDFLRKRVGQILKEWSDEKAYTDIFE